MVFSSPFIAVAAISCSSNPTESDAYKTMLKGMEELKANYNTIAEEVKAMEAPLAEMKASVAGMENADSTMTAAVAIYENAVMQGKTAMEKHTAMLEAQTQKLSAHATMDMTQIGEDFKSMTSEYEQMAADLNGVKQMASQAQAAYQTAMNTTTTEQ
ncbi:MAG: hypothetical protein R2769_11920 [Saprospiraceae bacterium]